MSEFAAELGRWGLGERGARERLYGAPTARERERWHDGRAPRIGGLLDQGWPAARVATALERDAHTVGDWLEGFRRSGPAGLAFEQTGGPPRPRRRSTGGVEGGGPRPATGGWDRLGRLELESGSRVSRGALRH